MPKAPKKIYSSDKKMEILKKHLVDKIPVSDVCDKYRISPSMFYGWQKRLFEGGGQLFDRPRGPKPAHDEKIAKLEAKLSQKDEVIAEIMADFIASKKKNGDL